MELRSSRTPSAVLVAQHTHTEKKRHRGSGWEMSANEVEKVSGTGDIM